MDININTLQELAGATPEILKYAGINKIFLFYGDMGAGKTTLIKSLCAALGVKDEVTSPTFSIVNEYAAENGPVYHFDFYRLKEQGEALDMGYEEYFFSDNYCFIEWPEKIAGLIPDQYTGVRIAVAEDGARQITVENI
ncbi:tRNA (adenosine(37)-N6)-threonylcarbamoyltransferase complex ATPase subunit type 1 TsaE [Mucilaginibacter psychrotolerans]|uniref:tRNA threonylcarbamoyladenosine biosynthesis protein TsaE n=1 Tax=Mucilaginibacter psychrotolerans TaxID=1524096 RepID=A0A4Y8SNZ5_9SPHI|nr:tRNA (adenosine(37)-N6)-threonylcarbamoyltransferase complex ATPase subunit type 1 TsaE [Mucilaginibacter psychrotolerans]TFF40350.1 tRNA (adenosine(37)-N6)-threonylcarbamoyltransferase complex ATPase subunit type 1 TsaE [Mucilaginibacter psychrotolerans]